MDVGSYSSMQQMQMRKMDGSGGGQGQGGMRDIMQSLSTQDRDTMKESLSSMSEEERMAAVTQMKEVDASAMSAEEYTQTLLDILTKADVNEAETEGFLVYA
ncbi:MAG: hypothetical protein OQK48_04220 [Sulfurimonas sp.]|uniref:hypothetical protein n=1 Tax=Sulfurimonas sp. TaxID=2022749 RepID=UPI0026128472|nr:hypothetical protein [Sulfurimonas sp.]MCW8895808.1 hypothetical protein [Sulfurimonas sp.]MCW8954126.1 hypothetical protein [Sulfurimonas sp.]